MENDSDFKVTIMNPAAVVDAAPSRDMVMVVSQASVHRRSLLEVESWLESESAGQTDHSFRLGQEERSHEYGDARDGEKRPHETDGSYGNIGSVAATDAQCNIQTTTRNQAYTSVLDSRLSCNQNDLDGNEAEKSIGTLSSVPSPLSRKAEISDACAAPAESLPSTHPPIIIVPPPTFPRTSVRSRRASLPSPHDYHRFYWNCMELKSELIRLDFAFRTLGSGGPGIQATNSVKLALRQLRDLYGTNTSALNPTSVNVQMYHPGDSCDYLSTFPVTFNNFGDALDDLARALHDFKMLYHDEKLMLQLFSLHSRFKAEGKATSFSIGVYATFDEFSSDMQKMLTEWLEDAITALTDAVRTFIDKGVPTIQNAQNNTLSRYLNMTTIAFFLSGTTASMIQVTNDANPSNLSVAANTCLFSSLVFSIGSAVNSLLVSGWRKSVVRDPDLALPFWLGVWLNAGPMVSLLVSGALFAAGVCLFIFSSGQGSVASAITVALTGIHASGLLFLFGYFIQERWAFRNNAGAIGMELTRSSLLLRGLEWTSSQLKALKQANHGEAGINIAITERELGARAAQVGVPEKTQHSETVPRSTGVVWHALSDERFLLQSKFIYPDQQECGDEQTADTDLGSPIHAPTPARYRLRRLPKRTGVLEMARPPRPVSPIAPVVPPPEPELVYEERPISPIEPPSTENPAVYTKDDLQNRSYSPPLSSSSMHQHSSSSEHKGKHSLREYLSPGSTSCFADEMEMDDVRRRCETPSPPPSRIVENLPRVSRDDETARDRATMQPCIIAQPQMASVPPAIIPSIQPVVVQPPSQPVVGQPPLQPVAVQLPPQSIVVQPPLQQATMIYPAQQLAQIQPPSKPFVPLTPRRDVQAAAAFLPKSSKSYVHRLA